LIAGFPSIYLPADARREGGVLLVGAKLGPDAEGWFYQRQFERLGIAQYMPGDASAKYSVIVPVGETALYEVCGLRDIKKYHGYVLDSPYGLAVPTFHPVEQPFAISKGNAKLTPLFCMVLQRALQLAREGFKPREYELLLDPSPRDAQAYFDEYPCERTLVCDIETDFSVGDEDDVDLTGGQQIVRISFSNGADTAISFPWTPPYIDIACKALVNGIEVVFWNQAFDVPRLRAAGCPVKGKVIDAMWAWHWLQSDLPKSLGFVAPLLMAMRPWKHENASRPAYYSAMDSAVTHDCYLKIKEALHCEGRLAEFDSEITDVLPLLETMGAKGLLIDAEAQAAFKLKLEGERDALCEQIQPLIPEVVKPVKVYKRKPNVTLPFNPGSPKQKKALFKALGLKIPTGKGGAETTQAKHLKKHSKRHPVLKLINDWGERSKLVTSYFWELDANNRIHPSFGFHPSTHRKSCRNPNVQTIPKRNDLAKEFRRMFIASPGTLLVECDSSAIEAVLVGYFAGSSDYIALAKRGVHKWLAEQRAGRPVSKEEPLYDQIKRVVHLSNYLGSAMRIREEYPDDFATQREAQELQDYYFSTPAGRDVRAWQVATLAQAHAEHMLDTPFRQRHYFYNVYTTREGKMVLGDDAKRAIAFRPQATASAIQSLFLRSFPAWMLPFIEAPVHDSFIAEVPEEQAKLFASEMIRVMTMPIPQLGGLSIGCEAKIGPNLASMISV
jgi:hypothetical protein